MPDCWGAASSVNAGPADEPAAPAQSASPVPARRTEKAATALRVRAGESPVRMAMINSVRSMAIQVSTSPSGLSIKTASKPNPVNARVPSQDATLVCELRAGEVNTTPAASALRLNAYNQESG